MTSKPPLIQTPIRAPKKHSAALKRNNGGVFSEILHWRALTTARFWFSLAGLTLAWSAGTGLAMKTIVPRFPCVPHSLPPLVKSPADLLALPWRAFTTIPYGLLESGLIFGLLAAPVLLFVTGWLPRGVFERVLNMTTVIVGACCLAGIAWYTEIGVAFHFGTLPSVVCSN